MDSRPPEFFYREATPLARLVFFISLAISLMVVDSRFKYLDAFRQSLTVVIHPLQQTALTPTRLFDRVSAFFVTQYQLQTENAAIKQQLLTQSEQVQRYQSLQSELNNLKKLLGARERVHNDAVLVEVVHTGRSPFSRKVVVDKGAQDGVKAGQAAVDAAGVVGQVTRVYPFSSEITLVTEKNQAVPILVLRNGLRAVIFGSGLDGAMELPFIPVNADIRNGDVLVTSGIDGTYPPGLAVATVTNIERNSAYVFLKIACAPSAGVDNYKYLLVLTGEKPENVSRAEAPTLDNKKAKREKTVKPARHKREE